MPDPATDTLRTALERIEALTGAVDGPPTHGEATFGRREVRQIARDALAAAPAEPGWEWRAVWPDGFTTSSQPDRGAIDRVLADDVGFWVERRRKAGEWERVT